MTLKEKLLAAGYKESEMFHWISDLYVFKTPETEKIIREHYESKHQSFDHNCTSFIDNVTGRPMYECVFEWYE